MLLAAPGRLATTTFGAPITAIQRKLPQDRASASDSGKYIRAYQSLLFTANRHDHAYRCRRSDRVLLVLHGHLHIGPHLYSRKNTPRVVAVVGLPMAVCLFFLRSLNASEAGGLSLEGSSVFRTLSQGVVYRVGPFKKPWLGMSAMQNQNGRGGEDCTARR
jgi:hypothetical protein